MTKQEQLQKIIEKAVEGGWGLSKDEHIGIKALLFRYKLSPEHNISEVNGTIFSHDFLKAFFGEYQNNLVEFPLKREDGTTLWQAWQFHGMKMLLSEDPIKYLAAYV